MTGGFRRSVATAWRSFRVSSWRDLQHALPNSRLSQCHTPSSGLSSGEYAGRRIRRKRLASGVFRNAFTDALAHILPSWADRLRRRLADFLSAAFCGYFAWKSWQLLGEALDDGQTTPSAWGPPLWIPYGCMTIGMALLTLQLLLQLLAPEDRR